MADDLAPPEQDRQEPSGTVVRWLLRWRVLLGTVVGGLLHVVAAVVSASGHDLP